MIQLIKDWVLTIYINWKSVFINKYILDWFESEKYCQALGGNLASFQSQSALNIVDNAGQISTNFNSSAVFWIGRHYWIGLNIINKTAFEWSDGRQFRINKCIYIM